MSFYKKSFVVGHFRGIVFVGLLFLAVFCPFLPANALTLTTWQNMVSNGTSTLFWFDASDTFLNLGYQFDTYGFPYWSVATDTPSLTYVYLKQFSTSTPNWDYSITVPTDSEGYKFWIIQKGGDIYDRIFRYKNGGSWYYGYCTLIKNITLADKTLQLTRCDGVEINPITNILVSMGAYTTVEEIYLLVYTDDDLDTLITDEASMYAYLNNLANYNSLYGNWTPETGVSVPAGTCDNLDVFSGALCKVLTFLFVPTQKTLTQYSNLKDLVITKPPFGYYNSIKTAIAGLTSTTTPAFSLTASISDISIFGTLKTGLAWILWIFFSFWIIKRIARFEF
jgi:hypothetical protein